MAVLVAVAITLVLCLAASCYSCCCRKKRLPSHQAAFLDNEEGASTELSAQQLPHGNGECLGQLELGPPPDKDPERGMLQPPPRRPQPVWGISKQMVPKSALGNDVRRPSHWDADGPKSGARRKVTFVEDDVLATSFTGSSGTAPAGSSSTAVEGPGEKDDFLTLSSSGAALAGSSSPALASDAVTAPATVPEKALEKPRGQRKGTIHAGKNLLGEELEDEVVMWLEEVTEESRGDLEFGKWLKDGVILCKAVNVVQEDSVKRINLQKMPFKQMENISNFIGACRKLGVLEKDLFSTVDLYEEKNLKGVMLCVYNLASVVRTTVPTFRGPFLGVVHNAKVLDAKRAQEQVSSTSGFRQDTKDEVKAGVQHGRANGDK